MTILMQLLEALTYSGFGFLLGWMATWTLRDAH